MAIINANVEAPKELKLKDSKKGKITNMAYMLKEIADFKGWEIIFQVLFYSFICWGIHSLYLVYEFHHDPATQDVRKFALSDFKYSLIPALLSFFYKRLSHRLFFGFLKRSLDPKKFPTEQEQNARAEKNALWLSHIIFYIFTSSLAYYLFKDTFFYPTYLGGSGSCSAIYANTPHVPHIPYAVLYYQIQFGWHFHTLVDHVVYKWREPKFWEMFLHHGVAVFLIFFSYLSNQVPVGLLVFVTHDPCDIGLYGTRFYNDRKNKKLVMNYLIYASFMLTWMYLRLFVFPKCIVGEGFYAFFKYRVDPMNSVYLYLLVMMTALVILHLYWFIIMLRIVVDLIQGKADPNLYDKSRKSN